MLDKFLEMKTNNPKWFFDLDPTKDLSIKELVI
jgi:hypothetical protein